MKQPVQQPIIQATNLGVSYGRRTVWAGANFQIKSGEFIAILGPNGSGKSTLLRMILGLMVPTKGKLSVFGQAPHRGNPAIGYVPQARPIDPEAAIRGRDLVGFGIDGHRWGVRSFSAQQSEIDQRIEAAIQSVGAGRFADRRVGELSGGERQRLLLAQALVGEPKLMVLDEPLASLDLKNQIVIAELVAKLAKERNIAVMFVTHDINPLLSVVDRVLYLAPNGIAIGKPEEVVTSRSLASLYGTPIEVLTDSHGRRVVIGLEGGPAHHHGADEPYNHHVHSPLEHK